MRVEIYSDVVCPWCYIGKRRFEKALAAFSGRDEVELVWRPFQLDPTAPAMASPAFDAYSKKFGGPHEASRIIGHVSEVAAGEGLEFRLDLAQRANTFDAHRLLWLAERLGCQDELKERLLHAYFSEGRNIADHGVLIDIAVEAGIHPDRAAHFLDSPEGIGEVRDEIADAYERGITAVPTFVIDGVWSVPGAQDPDVLLRVLERRAAQLGEAASAEV